MVVPRRIGRLAPLAVAVFVALAALVSQRTSTIRGTFAMSPARRRSSRSVALGQLLVVVVRGLDLSVGAVITATLLLIVELAGTAGGSLPVVLVAIVAMAVAVGRSTRCSSSCVGYRRSWPPSRRTPSCRASACGSPGDSARSCAEAIKPLGTGKVGPFLCR